MNLREIKMDYQSKVLHGVMKALIARGFQNYKAEIALRDCTVFIGKMKEDVYKINQKKYQLS